MFIALMGWIIFLLGFLVFAWRIHVIHIAEAKLEEGRRIAAQEPIKTIEG